MSGRLAGETVVVIGGSSGIGAAVALLAHSEGASVYSVSRSGKTAVGIGIAADLTVPGELQTALHSIDSINHLVHTVGARLPSEPLASLDMDTVALGFQTKLFSAIEAVKLVLPSLASTASITLTSGQLSRKFGVGSVLKGVINAATEAAGKHLAKELAPRRVNVISPGVVDTELWGEAGSQARKTAIERVSSVLPVKRVALPQELAKAYLFAMTNGFVTGAILDVDGGGLL